MAPFQSEAQRRFMYAHNPTLAKEYEKKTKSKKLPKKVSSSKSGVVSSKKVRGKKDGRK